MLPKKGNEGQFVDPGTLGTASYSMAQLATQEPYTKSTGKLFGCTVGMIGWGCDR